MNKICTFMSTWEGSPPYPRHNVEAVSLTISRKNDVQPCWSEDGTPYGYQTERNKYTLEELICKP